MSLPRAMRRSHRTVLEAVADEGAATRAEIEAMTGLSRATVATTVRELSMTGALCEVSSRSASGGRGRRPTEFRLAAPPGLVCAIDMGHQHVAVALGGCDGSMVRSRWFDRAVDDDPQDALAAAIDLARDLLTDAREKGPLQAVAVSVPQPVSDTHGALAPTPFLTTWHGVQVAEQVNAAMDVPVYVENDANAGALAESDRHSSVAFVKVSTGIGMGLAIGTTLIRGAQGQAGEIGHVVIEPDGQLCGCGNRGCLETLASLPAVIRALTPVHGPLAPVDLTRLLDAGDAPSARAMHDAGCALGTALAPVIAALQVDRIVIDGPREIPVDAVVDGVRTRVATLLHPQIVRGLVIERSRYGHGGSVVGALRLAADRVARVALGIRT